MYTHSPFYKRSPLTLIWCHPVWLDVGIKSSLHISKTGPNSPIEQFLLKSVVFQDNPKVIRHLGEVWRQFCNQELLKIAHSGHTDSNRQQLYSYFSTHSANVIQILEHRNSMVIGDNSQTRSPLGVQVKQLTKICWHLTCSPIHTRLLGRDRFKPCVRPGYFLLQLSDCMMETCMLLAVVRVHEQWWPQ